MINSLGIKKPSLYIATPFNSILKLIFVLIILQGKIHEFVQEKESDMEFYELFNKWLHEEKQTAGYCNTYIFVYLRRGQKLTEDEFGYFERNIAECFEKNPIWLYEVNYRMRFRLRIRLICCSKLKFRRVVRRKA